MIKSKKYVIISCYFEGDLRVLNYINFIMKGEDIVDFIKDDVEVLHGVKRLAIALNEDIEFIKITNKNCNYKKFIKKLKWLVSMSSDFTKLMTEELVENYQGKNKFICEILGKELKLKNDIKQIMLKNK